LSYFGCIDGRPYVGAVYRILRAYDLLRPSVARAVSVDSIARPLTGLGPESRMEEGEISMQLYVSPDIEALVQKRLATGAYANAEDVIRQALEAQDAEESWTEEERRALATHIEEGFLQAERGELIDGEEARRQIRAMKERWLQERSSSLPG